MQPRQKKVFFYQQQKRPARKWKSEHIPQLGTTFQTQRNRLPRTDNSRFPESGPGSGRPSHISSRTVEQRKQSSISNVSRPGLISASRSSDTIHLFLTHISRFQFLLSFFRTKSSGFFFSPFFQTFYRPSCSRRAPDWVLASNLAVKADWLWRAKSCLELSTSGPDCWIATCATRKYANILVELISQWMARCFYAQ